MNTTNSLDKVRFLPWKGKNYESCGIFHRRIMVLGESHHCGECTRKECESYIGKDCMDFTINTVNDFINKPNGHKGWMNTYTKFERSLVGEYTDEELRKQIWDSLLFYNYLQYALDGPRKEGEGDSYVSAAEPFFQVLNYYEPEIIIAWGERLWNYLPGNEKWEAAPLEDIDGSMVECGYYHYAENKKAMIFFVNHPSSGYSWDYWYMIIKYMLEKS